MRLGIAFLATLLLGTGGAGAETVDQIVEKNVEARGGLAALKGIRSLRMTGVVGMGPSAQIGLVMEFRRPRMVRQEFSVPGATGVAAYDGATAWQVMPFAGKVTPERMTPDERKEMEEQADIEGDLVDWRTKENVVELLGRESLSGVETWKLRVTPKAGTARTVWLDAATFLEIQSESKRKIDGKEVEFVSSIGDYRTVSGLRLPYLIETRVKGAVSGQKITLQTIEVNVPIDEGRFRMPEPKPPATAVPGK
jgi:hypothetical protein